VAILSATSCCKAAVAASLAVAAPAIGRAGAMEIGDPKERLGGGEP
jgi:hypothetical protein